MSTYDVVLKFEGLEASDHGQAAEQIFEAFFKDSLWQPDFFEVLSHATGELLEVEVNHLRNDCPLYSAPKISQRLRSPVEMLLVDVSAIEKGIVVVGTIQSGVLNVGDLAYALQDGAGIFCTVAGLTVNGELVSSAYFSEDVGVLFQDPNAAHFAPGMVLKSHGAA